MARRRKQRTLKPRLPARVKKKGRKGKLRSEQHLELTGLGLLALGVFLASILYLGWGGGLLSKIAVEDTSGDAFRAILKRFSLYERALQTGLPFPKTRRVVFSGGQPASLPGWVLLEVV